MLDRLRTCLNELAKFGGHDVTAGRAALDAAAARFAADLPRFQAARDHLHPSRPAPRGTIDRA